MKRLLFADGFSRSVKDATGGNITARDSRRFAD
jgi:hypothetical protein